MASWQPIETAPKDWFPVLVCFKGQFDWLYFVAQANGKNTCLAGYAIPTHWMPLPEAPQLETNSSIPKPLTST